MASTLIDKKDVAANKYDVFIETSGIIWAVIMTVLREYLVVKGDKYFCLIYSR